MATATAATKISTTTRGHARGATREYETIYIMRGNVDPKEAEQVTTRANGVIDQNGGRILKVDNWGRRKLAYPIDGATRGAFVYLRYLGGADLVRELERNLAMLDDVVRWQTMLLRADVQANDYQINDDDVRYEPLEADTAEEEPGLAQRLGLVERPAGEEGQDRYDRNEGRDDNRGSSSPGDEEEE